MHLLLDSLTICIILLKRHFRFGTRSQHVAAAYGVMVIPYSFMVE